MKKLQINYILLSLFILGLHQTTTDAMFPNRDDQNQSGAKIPTEKVPKQRSFNSVSDEPIIYDVTSLTEEEKIDFNQELAKFKKDCFEIELQIQRYYQENPERRPKNDSDENGLMAGIKIEDAIQDIIRKIIAARTPAAEKARPAAASEDQPAVVAATAGATDNTAYQRLLLDKSKEAIGLYISTLRSQDKSLDQIQRLIENAIQEMEPLSGFEYRKILRDAKIIMNKSMERGERENIALFSIQQYIALLRDGLYKDTDALDFYPLMQRTAKNIIDELKTEEFFAQEQALAERQAAPRPSASAASTAQPEDHELPQAVAVVIAKPASAIHRRALEEENQITQEYMIRLINQGNSLDQVTQEMANAAEFLQELIESNYSTAMINEIFGISPSLRQNIQNRALNIRDITTTQEYIYTMFLLGKKQQKSTAESFINIQDIITRNAEIISHHR